MRPDPIGEACEGARFRDQLCGHPAVEIPSSCCRDPTSVLSLGAMSIPHLSGLGRVLAPDLVGFGASSKSPGHAYKFTDHVRYLDAWFDGLNLTRDVTLVLHDWGSALGFPPSNALSISGQGDCPYGGDAGWFETGADFDPLADIFRALADRERRADGSRRQLFVEQRLPAGCFGTLSPRKWPPTAAHFKTREDRLPTLSCPRNSRRMASQRDVSAIVDAYGAWLVQSKIPKTVILAEAAPHRSRAFDFARTWPNQREITVKRDITMQEDVPMKLVSPRRFVRSLGPAREFYYG